VLAPYWAGETTAFLYLFESLASRALGDLVARRAEGLPDLSPLPVTSDIVSSRPAMPIDMLSTSFYPGALSAGSRLGGFRHGRIVSRAPTVNETVEKRS
jgi:hypothetical protein